jgi:hypothetical protein
MLSRLLQPMIFSMAATARIIVIQLRGKFSKSIEITGTAAFL